MAVLPRFPWEFNSVKSSESASNPSVCRPKSEVLPPDPLTRPTLVGYLALNSLQYSTGI